MQRSLPALATALYFATVQPLAGQDLLWLNSAPVGWTMNYQMPNHQVRASSGGLVGAVRGFGPAMSFGQDIFSSLSVECSAMMQALQSQPQIVVAAIDGVATAAGCQLVAAADLAIATTRSRFATPGVNIGLWCVTPMVALSRAVAPKHAMQMLATGELMDAEFAVRIGLVNEAVAPDAFEARVSQLAGQIAAKSTFTLATGKRAFYRQLQMSTAEAYEYVGEVGVRNSIHPDAIEGIQASLTNAHWPGAAARRRRGCPSLWPSS